MACVIRPLLHTYHHHPYRPLSHIHHTRHPRAQRNLGSIPPWFHAFITTDATGRIMEPHDGLLHPTSSWISIVPRKVDDNKHAEHERSLLRTALTDNPEWLIGRQAHKFFPEWMGTCRAEVTGYDPVLAD